MSLFSTRRKTDEVERLEVQEQALRVRISELDTEAVRAERDLKLAQRKLGQHRSEIERETERLAHHLRSGDPQQVVSGWSLEQIRAVSLLLHRNVGRDRLLAEQLDRMDGGL